MADPGDKTKRATYQDVLDAPPHMVAEVIDGELDLSAVWRDIPRGPHTGASERAADYYAFGEY